MIDFNYLKILMKGRIYDSHYYIWIESDWIKTV